MTVKVDEHEEGPSVMMRKGERDERRGDAAAVTAAIVATVAIARVATATANKEL